MKKMTVLLLLATSIAVFGGCAMKPVVEKTIPTGTPLKLELVSSLSSADSTAGDSFEARVAEDVVVDGKVAIPASSTVSGRVVAARGLKAIGGRALLSLEFTAVDTPSGEVPINASWSRQGKSETKKDAAIIGGSAGGGALLGRVLDRHHEAKGTLLGGILGGAAGTAIAAGTKGEEIHLPSGTALTVSLQAPVTAKIEA
jgi:hypothetical protein